MQAEAAEAQSIQDAEAIEQMQAVIHHLDKGRMTESPAEVCSVLGVKEASPCVSINKYAATASVTPKMNILQADAAGSGILQSSLASRAAPDSNGFEHSVQDLQAQLEQVSKDAGDLLTDSNEKVAAQMLHLETRLNALTATLTSNTSASRAAVHELQERLAAAQADRLQDHERQAAGIGYLQAKVG